MPLANHIGGERIKALVAIVVKVEGTTKEETAKEIDKIVDEIRNSEFWNDNEFVRTKVKKVYYDVDYDLWYANDERERNL